MVVTVAAAVVMVLVVVVVRSVCFPVSGLLRLFTVVVAAFNSFPSKLPNVLDNSAGLDVQPPPPGMMLLSGCSSLEAFWGEGRGQELNGRESRFFF